MPFSRLRYEFKDDYEWVRVTDTFPERQRVLHFEDSIQGAISLDDHRRPVIEYIRVMVQGARAFKSEVAAVLIGGLGSCGLLHAVRSWCRRSADIVTVEANPRVCDIAKRYFRLENDSPIVIGDFRLELNREPGTSFDLILVDCYSATSIPPHLTTLECQELVRRRLNPGGLAVFNLWDASCNELWGAQLRTLLQVFDRIWLGDCREDHNTVVFAVRGTCPTPPAGLVIQGEAYPLRAVSLAEPERWPREVAAAGGMNDDNLEESRGAIGVVV